jgi:hypothetical protein
LGTGIPLAAVEAGRSAANRHFDRKTNGLNSIQKLLLGLVAGGNENSGSDDSSTNDLEFRK